MTLEQQVRSLEVRVRKLERYINNIESSKKEQREFEIKRDEAMNDIGHDM